MAKAQRAQTRAVSKRDAGTSVTVAPAAGMDLIAQRAYEIWKESGCPDGHDQEHWFHAERELRVGAPRR